MSTQLSFGRDMQGYNAYAPQFATDNYSATLANATEEKITVPSNHSVWIASFSYEPGASVWVALNATAAVPAGGTFASTTSTLNPGTRTVNAGDVLHLITDDTTADVGVTFYAASYP